MLEVSSQNSSLIQLKKEDIEFLKKLPEFVKQNLTQIEEVVSSCSLWSTVKFAFNNFGFFWKNRGVIQNFSGEKFKLLLESQTLPTQIVIGICTPHHMSVFGEIAAKISKFLQSWFIPKFIYKAIPDHYKKIIDSPKVADIIQHTKSASLSGVLKALGESSKVRRKLKQDVKNILHDSTIKSFFKSSLMQSEDRQDFIKQGRILSALIAYAQSNNEIVKDYLKATIVKEMEPEQRTKFDSLLASFKSLTSTETSCRLKTLAQSQQADQVALFEVLKNLATLGEDVREPLKQYMLLEDNKRAFEKVLEQTLTQVFTLPPAPGGQSSVQYIGMNDSEGQRLVKAVAQVVVHSILTPAIQPSGIMGLAVTLIRKEAPTVSDIDKVLNDVNTLTLQDSGNGGKAIAEMVEALVPLIASSPLVAGAVAKMLPGGKIGETVELLRPVIQAVLTSGKLNDPDIGAVIHGLLTEPEAGRNPMSLLEMVRHLQSFTAKDLEKSKPITQAISQLLESEYRNSILESASSSLAESVINSFLRPRIDIPMTEESEESVEVAEEVTSPADLEEEPLLEVGEEPKSAELLQEREAVVSLAPVTADPLEPGEVTEISTLVAQSVGPLLGNATDISSAFLLFDQTARKLKQLKEDLAGKSLITTEEKTNRQELKREYKERLKALAALVFSDANLAGLADVNLSDALQAKLAIAATNWLLGDPERQAFVAEAFSSEERSDTLPEVIRKAMPVILHVVRSAPLVKGEILDLFNKVVDLDMKQPVDKRLASLKEVTSLLATIISKCGSDEAVKEQVFALFNAASPLIAKLTDMQLKTLGVEGLIEGAALVEVIKKDFSLDKLIKINEIVEKITQLASISSDSDDPKIVIKGLIGDLMGYKDISRSLVAIINPEVLAGVLWVRMSNAKDQVAQAAKKEKLEKLGLTEDVFKGLVQDFMQIGISLSEKSRETTVAPSQVQELLNASVDLDFTKAPRDILGQLNGLTIKLSKVMHEYAVEDEIKGRLKQSLQAAETVMQNLIESQLQEVFGSHMPLHGRDLVAIFKELPESGFSSVQNLITNLQAFSRLDKMLPYLKLELDQEDFNKKVTRRNDLLGKVINTVFELDKLSKSLLPKIKIKELSAFLTDRLTSEPMREMSVDEVEQLIKLNIRSKRTSSESVDILVERVRLTIYGTSTDGQKTLDEAEVEKYIRANFKSLGGAKVGIDEVIKIVKDHIYLANNLVPRLDPQKMARLKQFKLDEKKTAHLISWSLETVFAISKLVADSGDKKIFEEITEKLLKYDPESDMVDRLSYLFTGLKTIGEKNPIFKADIDERIMRFMTFNDKIMKPMMGAILDKYFKSYSFKLFKSGITPDELYDRIKHFCTVDKLENIFKALNTKGVGSYLNLASIASSLGFSDLLGLATTAARSAWGFVSSWLSTGSVATDMVKYINLLRPNGIAAGEPVVLDLREIPNILQARESNASFESEPLLLDVPEVPNVFKPRKGGVSLSPEMEKRLSIGYLGELKLGTQYDRLRFANSIVRDIDFDSSEIYLSARNTQIENSSFYQAQLSGEMTGGAIESCNMTETRLKNFTPSEVVFENIDFSQIGEVEGFNPRVCTFKNCTFSPEILRQMPTQSKCTFVGNKFLGDCKHFAAYTRNKSETSLAGNTVSALSGSSRKALRIDNGSEPDGARRSIGDYPRASYPENLRG